MDMWILWKEMFEDEEKRQQRTSGETAGAMRLQRPLYQRRNFSLLTS